YNLICLFSKKTGSTTLMKLLLPPVGSWQKTSLRVLVKHNEPLVARAHTFTHAHTHTSARNAADCALHIHLLRLFCTRTKRKSSRVENSTQTGYKGKKLKYAFNPF
ncbi:hypothetical protein IscW_ISCW015925, partial [Ixodes scapularis]